MWSFWLKKSRQITFISPFWRRTNEELRFPKTPGTAIKHPRIPSIQSENKFIVCSFSYKTIISKKILKMEYFSKTDPGKRWTLQTIHVNWDCFVGPWDAVEGLHKRQNCRVFITHGHGQSKKVKRKTYSWNYLIRKCKFKRVCFHLPLIWETLCLPLKLFY